MYRTAIARFASLAVLVSGIAFSTPAPTASAACAAPYLEATGTIGIGSAGGALPNLALVGNLLARVPGDGLGAHDLVVLTHATTLSTSSLSVYAGNGDGTYQPTARAVTTVPGSVLDMALGDVNADGFADVAVNSFVSGTGAVQVLLGRGDGSFTSPLTLPVGAVDVRSMAIADFDGDHHLDVLGVTRTSLLVFLGNGDGSFPTLRTSDSSNGYSVVTGDFNGDHRMDVAMVNTSLVLVQLGNGDGTFQAPRFWFVPRDNFSEVISVAAGDVNLDGRADLVAASTGNARASVLLGNGDGTFQPAVSYGVPLDGDWWSGSPARTVTLANLNADAAPDVVITNVLSPGVAFLINRGDGTLLPPISSPTRFTESVNAGDVNHDGLDDVVTVSGGGPVTVTVLAARCPTVAPHSLSLNGSGFAQAPHSADLNLSADWTIETWFKDEDPHGFDHDYALLLNKGDRQTSGESSYYISLGFKRLLIGQRTAWADYGIAADLQALHADPAAWHHVAGTYRAASRQLTVFLDGVQAAQGIIAAASTGNTLPLQIGRNGPGAGKYFTGKLDDIRLWNVARNGSDIAVFRFGELPVAQPGLIANWKLDESAGLVLADSAGSHTAILDGGAQLVEAHP